MDDAVCSSNFTLADGNPVCILNVKICDDITIVSFLPVLSGNIPKVHCMELLG